MAEQKIKTYIYMNPNPSSFQFKKLEYPPPLPFLGGNNKHDDGYRGKALIQFNHHLSGLSVVRKGTYIRITTSLETIIV